MIYILLKTVSVPKSRKVVVQIALASEGKSDLEERHFLIRPSISIKKELLATCGIDKSKLLQAPPFCDVANELIEIIGTQTVGFLSNFQYRLFVSEFKNIGYNCNLNYKSLDWVFKRLNILPSETPTAHLLQMLALELGDASNENPGVALLYNYYTRAAEEKTALQQMETVKQNSLAMLRTSSALLHKPGVYYFKNDRDEVIYVGKAKKVKKRLQSHFSNAGNQALYEEISVIDVEYTGSDLIAQLLESHEIKNLAPKFNSQQVKTPAPYQILIKKNKEGIKRFVMERKTYQDTEGDLYYNRNSAKARLAVLCKNYTLCPKFCSLERKAGPCTASKTGACRGVCAQREAIEVYNDRVTQAQKALQHELDHKIIKVNGRKPGESGFVLITNGIYQGFGFYNREDSITTINDLEPFVARYPNNYDTNRIIATLLKKTPKDRILNIMGGF